MGIATQEDRLLKITTQLPDDFLLINKFVCEEAVSELFSIEVELLHEEDDEDVYKFSPIDPTKVLGQKASIAIVQEDGGERCFSGIFSRFNHIGRERNFTKFTGTIVPHIWVLTQNFQSRIFQHISVPDILAEVFDGYEVNFQLQAEYQKRNYCLQYQETDFDFASRLMEEEGIYYYFEHSPETDRMIIRDDFKNPEDCPSKADIPVYNAELQGAQQWESSMSDFNFSYQLSSGRHVYWDHNFQLPQKKLDTEKTSRFNVGGNQEMEVYTYPGGYARKYDGIDKGGGKQTGELNHIFQDNKNTATNQMLSNDANYMTLQGLSDCCAITAGYRFRLQKHPNNEMNNAYILLKVHHEASQNPGYLVGTDVGDAYRNNFTCIPHGSGQPEYRPPRKTKKPVISGSQSAYVVGPAGEEIYTDEFGRVKVQFHWDREGQVDANSSCWLRVLQAWAGNRWGMMFIPRIGMEVIVNFIEGDPDQPVVAGCVYNPQTMPPYELPAEKTKMTIKSDSSTGGKGFNEIRFEDKKGSEQIFLHGEKDIDTRNKNDRREWVGNDHHYIVKRDRREKIERDVHLMTDRHVYQKIGEESHTKIGSDANMEVGGSLSLKVASDIAISSNNMTSSSMGNVGIKGTNVVLEATASLTIKCGASFVNLSSAGVAISGPMVLINSGGAAGSVMYSSPAPPTAPEKPDTADDDKPGSKVELEKRSAARKEKTHKQGNEEKKSWVKIKFVDEAGQPVKGVRYKVTAPDGRVASGSTDKDGKAEVKNMDPGTCKITFPDLDKEAWEEG